jgi:IS5 family transposase
MQIVSYQEELSPALPTVVGNVDYQEFRSTLLRIDEILKRSGAERQFIDERVAAYRQAAEEKGREAEAVSPGELSEVARQASQALRGNITRQLLGESARGLSTRLADSPLLQSFCGIARLDVIRVPGKSTVDRYGKLVDEEAIRKVIDQVSRAAAQPARRGKHVLGLEKPLDLEAYFLDTTCVQANIHFPTDWVLLRDAARTLIKAIRLIRTHGLKHRMPKPEALIREMNRLSIQMTQTARSKRDSKRERKRVLRQMKELMRVIRRHASRYRDLLAERWADTELSWGQASVVLDRMDRVLELLPRAIWQAHERIIAGRKVANAQKILSLYEPDLHVIVRGKASVAVEFGNALLLGETREGVIVDWQLFQEQVSGDALLVKDSVERFSQLFGRNPGALGADRGFDDKGNRDWLDQEKIYNAICPKSPRRQAHRMTDERFVKLQRRRAQSEARVAIFKNGFLGRPMRSKGFLNRERDTGWAVLAHNLWVIARLPRAEGRRAQWKQAA